MLALAVDGSFDWAMRDISLHSLQERLLER